MQLSDYFYLEFSNHLASAHYEALYLLYQPLLGPHAISLYQTLVALATISQEEKHQILCDLTNLTLNELLDARKKLEAYDLLKTFMAESNSYLYQLALPLLPADFLNHYAFGLEFRQTFGMIFYETLKSKYQQTSRLDQTYQNISTRYDSSLLTDISEQELKKFLADQTANTKLVIPASFDSRKFFQGVSNTVFPKVLRTPENLALIAQLMSLYGFDEKEMLLLTVTSIDIAAGKLDRELLINKVRNRQQKITPEVISYQMAPIQFLLHLQQGLKVVAPDQKLLARLAQEIGLTNEVINALIEYVYEQNNKVLTPNYVLKLAIPLKTNEIKTAEAAQQFLKQFQTTTKRPKKTKVKVSPEVPLLEQTLTNQERTELLAKLKERFKQDG